MVVHMYPNQPGSPKIDMTCGVLVTNKNTSNYNVSEVYVDGFQSYLFARRMMLYGSARLPCLAVFSAHSEQAINMVTDLSLSTIR